MFTDLVTEVEHLSGLASDFLAVSGGRGATDVHGGDELRGAPSQQRPLTPLETAGRSIREVPPNCPAKMLHQQTETSS